MTSQPAARAGDDGYLVAEIRLRIEHDVG
jgi:hypothetical protein